jgi:hypothetical protein
MAQQSVIYPAEPILIVDRQFRRRKGRAADVPTFSVNSGKRDVTISVFGRRSAESHGTSTTQARTAAHGLQPSSASVNFQFVDANQHLSATRAKKRRPPKSKADHENGLAANSKQHVSDSPSASSSDSTSRDEDYLPTHNTLQLGGLVPRSSTTFYGYAGDHIGANAQDLLNYCQ